MHQYTIDQESRVKIIAIIGVFSFVAMSILSSAIIPTIENSLPQFSRLFSLVASLVGFGTIFAIFYKSFSHHLWKISPSFLVSAPDLNGEWTGCVSRDSEINFEHYLESDKSEFKNKDDIINSTLTIHQTWEKIEFNYERDLANEWSQSIVAGMLDTGGSGPDIWYIFRNSGDSQTGEYYGVARFDFDQIDGDKDVLKGRFFTGTSGGFDGEAIFERS